MTPPSSNLRIARNHADTGWLNRTVLGIGQASLFSDWSHEIATTLMPAFLASMGVAAAWLGVIEIFYYTDKLPRRKPIAVLGYVVTAFGTAAIGLATTAWHVLLARATAWLGRSVCGLRCVRRCSQLLSPARHMDAPLAVSGCWIPSARLSVPPPHYGCWLSLITTTQACLLSRSFQACSQPVS